MAEILEPSFRKRKLAAILHADVVGFSRLMGKDEAGTHQTLGELRRAVDPLIAAHGGRIVGTAGDSLLADFSSIVDALSCAVEMQRASRAIKEPVAPERRLEINPGDVENIMARGSVFVWAGRAAEAMPWLEGALRFDRANARAAFLLGTTYYFLDRYGAAIEAMDHALAGNLGRNTHVMGRSVLAAAYTELDRRPDAERERIAVRRMAPLLRAERFASQFGAQQARDHMLEGLKKAGFR